MMNIDIGNNDLKVDIFPQHDFQNLLKETGLNPMCIMSVLSNILSLSKIVALGKICTHTKK